MDAKIFPAGILDNAISSLNLLIDDVGSLGRE